MLAPMSDPRPGGPESLPLTALIARMSGGDDAAAEATLQRVYRELHDIARAAMGRERRDHTLQATALVHECWLRLVGDTGAGFACRAQFFRSAADAMRRILVEHARRRSRLKRGGAVGRTDLASAAPSVTEDPLGFLALDDAIRRLEERDPLAAEVVRLRFFAGLSAQETADVLGTSLRTVMREWAYARAVLFQALADDDEPTMRG